MTFFKKFNLKKIISFIGTILMIASLFFVMRQFLQMREELDFSILTNVWVFIPLLLVILGEAGTVILASINYRHLVIDISGVFVKPSIAIKAYNLANMYKFIPGGVMFVLGRHKMVVETENLSHKKVALATLMEGILWVIAAVIVSSIFAFDHFIYYIRQLNILPFVTIVLILIVLIMIPTLYHFRSRLQLTLKDVKSNATPLLIKSFAKRLVFMVILVNMWGISFLATLTILGQPITLSLGITIIGIYILSWLVGFLTPGAPSGLGIREFILLMFLGGILNEEILLSAIITHRALIILGDVVSYIVTSLKSD